ncbi:hypothetical protein GCM10010472_18820 [Pseudonocardia halophobica]|uniref:Uncharacterized protein n=1 Tax=Pseudonocardia halophobica TaxID=29401 RepID=A0A9W6L098_9PSEU|nr:hypothetical protein GCM10017577_10440 [Pseudonocardia halophobica]
MEVEQDLPDADADRGVVGAGVQDLHLGALRPDQPCHSHYRLLGSPTDWAHRRSSGRRETAPQNMLIAASVNGSGSGLVRG